MAWTYDPTNLDDSTQEGRKNIVRRLIGDTIETDPQLQDEEIYYSLTANNDDVYDAAIWCCRAIAASYARLVNTELDGALREDYSDLVDNYKFLAATLEKEKVRGSASLGSAFGGLTKNELTNKRKNTTLVPDAFYLGQFDYINEYTDESE